MADEALGAWEGGGRQRPFSWLILLRALAAVGGMGLSLLAGWLARGRGPRTADFSGILWLWLIGVAWFLLAFISPAAPSLKLDLQTCKLANLLGLAVLVVAALLVRTIDLAHIPANLGGDEGTQGVAALELVEPPLGNPFSTGWYSVPTMSFLAYGLSMRVFGETVVGLRALSALIGTATVLTTFLLARELWGRRVAWLAAALLACAHYHVHFSRLGSNQIADGLFVTLALWLLVRGLRSRGQLARAAPSLKLANLHTSKLAHLHTRNLYFALAGAVIGLAWYGYFGARLVGIIAVLYLAWRAIVERRFLSRHGPRLLILFGAALVVVTPLLFHYLAYPDSMTSRVRQVSIFASGWLTREQEITGRSVASLLLQQFWKSISAFNYTLDPTFWYHPDIPLLDFVSGILFVFGLVWATARWRWPSNGLLLIWFWLALLLGWVMTENPPSSQRMVVAAPALALLVSLGLNWLTHVVHRLLHITFHVSRFTFYVLRFTFYVLRFTFHVLRFTPYALLITIAALNLIYYFLIYSPTRVYGNPTAEIATELGRYLAQQDDDYADKRHPMVYFHAPPFIYWEFGTLRFLRMQGTSSVPSIRARGVAGTNVPPPGGGTPSPPQPDLTRGARGRRLSLFVFHPQRLDELGAVRARYPGGAVTRVHSSADGRLLYVLYEISR